MPKLSNTRKKRYRPTKPHYVAVFCGRRCPHKHYTAAAALKCLFSHARDVIHFNADVRTCLLSQVTFSIYIDKVQAPTAPQACEEKTNNPATPISVKAATYEAGKRFFGRYTRGENQ